MRLLSFSILLCILFHAEIQGRDHHFQISWLLWDHCWKTCLLTNLPEGGHKKQMIKNMMVSICWRHKQKMECIDLSCLPGFKQVAICNYYHCFVQYAECVSDEKQVKFWSRCPQNTPLGSPLKPASTVHLLKANLNNTVQCNKRKRNGKENWSRSLHNNVAGTMVCWCQKSTCQVTRSIVFCSTRHLLLLVVDLRGIIF
jgi:hypothetical protein